MIPRHTPLVIQFHAPILLQTPLQSVHPSLFRLPLALALGGAISSSSSKTVPSTCPCLRFPPPSFRRRSGRSSRAGSPGGSDAPRVRRFILGVCPSTRYTTTTTTNIVWAVRTVPSAISVTPPLARRTSFSPNHGRDFICGRLGTCGWWAVGGGGVIALASSGGRSRHGRLALWQ